MEKLQFNKHNFYTIKSEKEFNNLSDQDKIKHFNKVYNLMKIKDLKFHIDDLFIYVKWSVSYYDDTNNETSSYRLSILNEYYILALPINFMKFTLSDSNIFKNLELEYNKKNSSSKVHNIEIRKYIFKEIEKTYGYDPVPYLFSQERKFLLRLVDHKTNKFGLKTPSLFLEPAYDDEGNYDNNSTKRFYDLFKTNTHGIISRTKEMQKLNHCKSIKLLEIKKEFKRKFLICDEYGFTDDKFKRVAELVSHVYVTFERFPRNHQEFRNALRCLSGCPNSLIDEFMNKITLKFYNQLLNGAIKIEVN